MNHFDIIRWADFVRAIGDSSSRAEMQSHLETGCDQCEVLVGQLRRVVATPTLEATDVPPDYAVRSIKAYFALEQRETESHWSRLLLPPVFDSSRAPLPVGIRSFDNDLRRISYESGRYSVDLTVEHIPGSPLGHIVGQLLEEGQPKVPVPEIPAFLVNRGAVAATALTSEQGDFSLEGSVEGSCELWFFPDEERIIGVTWESNSELTSVH